MVFSSRPRAICDEPGDSPPLGRAGRGLLPWVFSAAAHLALATALGVTVSRGGGVDRLSSGATLQTSAARPRFELLDSSPLVFDSSADDSAAEGEEESNAIVPASARESAPLAATDPLLEQLDERPDLRSAALAGGAADDLLTDLGESRREISSASNLTRRGVKGRSSRPGGARTSVFGAAAEGHKFVYVFDRSASMSGHGGSPLAAAKEQLLSSLRDLGQTHQFQIIFYNDRPSIFQPHGDSGRLVFGNEQNKTLADRFVGAITASGATRHESALILALNLTPDVIFFLTDADEPRLVPRQLERIARYNRGSVIHAIEFGYGPRASEHNFLVQLARENNGQHVYVDVSKLSPSR